MEELLAELSARDPEIAWEARTQARVERIYAYYRERLGELLYFTD